MRITDIRLLAGDGKKLLARATIIIDEMLAINGLAVMPGRDGGLYLAMPFHTNPDGTKRETVHPLNKESRGYLERKIFEKYRSGEVWPRNAEK